jgi:hypothetical protein
MTRWLGKVLRAAGRLSIYLACCAATLFILANSFETAFGATLPFPAVKAVTAINLDFIRPQMDRYVSGLPKQTSAAREGTYGTPAVLKIGGNGIRIPIAQPLYRNGAWLARASTSHYVVMGDARGSNIGDVLIYMNGGKTTVSDASLIKNGGNIFVDTVRDWRYMYKITEVVTVNPDDTPYILPKSETGHVYAVVQYTDKTVVATGQLLDVQNANQ